MIRSTKSLTYVLLCILPMSEVTSRCIFKLCVAYYCKIGIVYVFQTKSVIKSIVTARTPYEVVVCA